MSPVSVFISRKTQRLYIRQAFQQVLESPVAIRDADKPIGTHIYTAVSYRSGRSGLRWTAISMHQVEDDPAQVRSASAALDRIAIPQDIADRVSEVISPGSSLIVSDEGPSAETGKGTDFVILMSGEPQGGIKKRRPNPEARYRYERPHGRPTWTAPIAPWPYFGTPFGRW